MDATLEEVLQELRLQGRFGTVTKAELLDARADQLRALVEKSVSLSVIVKVLAEVGVCVHKSTVARYLKDHFPESYEKNYPHRFAGRSSVVKTDSQSSNQVVSEEVGNLKPRLNSKTKSIKPVTQASNNSRSKRNPIDKKRSAVEVNSMVADYLTHNISEKEYDK